MAPTWVRAKLEYLEFLIYLLFGGQGKGGGNFPGQGVALTTQTLTSPDRTSIVAYIDSVLGSDLPQTDGSAAHPFKTYLYLYQRLQYLYGLSPLGPSLTQAIGPTGAVQPAISLATPVLEVFPQDNIPIADGVGILGNVQGPVDGGLVIHAPPATLVSSGTLTVTQAFNRAATPSHWARVSDAGANFTAAVTNTDLIIDTTLNTQTWAEVLIAPTQVETSQWVQPVSPIGLTTTTVPTILQPANGNTYEVRQLGTSALGVGLIQPRQNGFIVGGPGTNPFYVTFEGFHFNDIATTTRGASDGFAQVNFLNCVFDGFLEPAQSCNTLNCAFRGGISVFDNDHRIVNGFTRISCHNDETSNATFDGDLRLEGIPIIAGSMGGAALGLVGHSGTNLQTIVIDPGANLEVISVFYGAALVYQSANNLLPIECLGNGAVYLQTGFAANINLVSSIARDVTAGSTPYQISVVLAAGSDTIRDEQTGSIVGLSQPNVVFPQGWVTGGQPASLGTPLVGVILTGDPPTTTAYPVSTLGVVPANAIGHRWWVYDGAGVWHAIAGV
jgi:hypothetical protein